MPFISNLPFLISIDKEITSGSSTLQVKYGFITVLDQLFILHLVSAHVDGRRRIDRRRPEEQDHFRLDLRLCLGGRAGWAGWARTFLVEASRFFQVELDFF